MKKNTSITLGDYFDQFVQSLLSEGRYKNTSEVIRAGLRLLEVEEQEKITLRKTNQSEIEGLVSDNLAQYQSSSNIESIEIKTTVSKLTKKELNARIDQSESDFKKGKFKTSTELTTKYK